MLGNACGVRTAVHAPESITTVSSTEVAVCNLLLVLVAELLVGLLHLTVLHKL